MLASTGEPSEIDLNYQIFQVLVCISEVWGTNYLHVSLLSSSCDSAGSDRFFARVGWLSRGLPHAAENRKPQETEDTGSLSKRADLSFFYILYAFVWL